jgi:hypothetical protein
METAKEIDRILTLMSAHGLVVVRDWRGACRLAAWDGEAHAATGGTRARSRRLRFLDLPKPPSSTALHTMLEANLIEMAAEYASSGASVHTLTKEGWRLAQWRIEIRMRSEGTVAAGMPRGPRIVAAGDAARADTPDTPAARRHRLLLERDARIRRGRARIRKQAELVRRLKRRNADTAMAERLLAEMTRACRLLEARQRAATATLPTGRSADLRPRLLGER